MRRGHGVKRSNETKVSQEDIGSSECGVKKLSGANDYEAEYYGVISLGDLFGRTISAKKSLHEEGMSQEDFWGHLCLFLRSKQTGGKSNAGNIFPIGKASSLNTGGMGMFLASRLCGLCPSRFDGLMTHGWLWLF